MFLQTKNMFWHSQSKIYRKTDTFLLYEYFSTLFHSTQPLRHLIIMTEDSFEDLFQDKTIQQKPLQPGDKLNATVASISGDNIFLDIGGKSEGVLNASELRNAEGELELTTGDTVTVFLLTMRGGEITFTTKLGSGHSNLHELEAAFSSSIPVEGKVVKEVKGGFEINIAGQRAFCPYSQMGLRRVEDPEEYLEQSLSFKIIEFGNRGRNIIVSARALLEEKREEEKQLLQETLSENMQVKGVVTSIRDFGAFVDIGGVDGLIPMGELAWGQVDRAEDILEQGQEVEVLVQKLDWENDRISLSLKKTTESPWTKAQDEFPEGSVHQGTISRLTKFGAFVSLKPGLDGLLHISKLGDGKRIMHPREAVEAGQLISVRVEKIDVEAQKISLTPEDYKESGKEVDHSYKEKMKSTPKSFGTLGDLLQKQLLKKK